MVRLQVMTQSYSRNARPKLKALRDNPRFHIFRPAPIAPLSRHNLAPPNKPITAIRHSNTLLKAQKKNRPSSTDRKPQTSMGRRRRILIIHHVAAANKNTEENRPRGSTALEGNADTVLMLEQIADHVVLRCKKQRSGPKPEPLRFQIESYFKDSHEKDRGRKPRSLPKATLLEGEANSTAASAEIVKKNGSKAQKDDTQLRVEEVLRLMRNAAVVDENLTKTELKSLLSDTFDSNAPSSDGRRKTLDRVLDSMIGAGLISIGPGKRYELLR